MTEQAIDRSTVEERLISISQVLDQAKAALEPVEDPDERLQMIQTMRGFLHSLSPLKHHPVDNVRWVPASKVHANNYNPNQVARREMALLYHSIQKDHYTQPAVCVYDSDKDEFVIVDGFHRYLTLVENDDLMRSTMGRLPLVVLNASLADRMGATVRHNRARGKHSMEGMANTVFKMLEQGMTSEEVAQELGLETDEIVRYKITTGFEKLYEDVEFRREWQTNRQLLLGKKWREENPEGGGFGSG